MLAARAMSVHGSVPQTDVGSAYSCRSAGILPPGLGHQAGNATRTYPNVYVGKNSPERMAPPLIRLIQRRKAQRVVQRPRACPFHRADHTGRASSST